MPNAGVVGAVICPVHTNYKKNICHKNIRVAAEIRVGRVTGTTSIFSLGLSKRFVVWG